MAGGLLFLAKEVFRGLELDKIDQANIHETKQQFNILEEFIATTWSEMESLHKDQVFTAPDESQKLRQKWNDLREVTDNLTASLQVAANSCISDDQRAIMSLFLDQHKAIQAHAELPDEFL